MIKLSLISAAVIASALATASHAEVSFNANIETNTTKVSGEDIDNGGRVEINAIAELAKNGDYFINAKGTLGLGLTGDPYIDDAWLQLGSSQADVKFGRFEATDLFPLGKDVLVQAAGDVGGYRANVLRGRVTTGALHAAAGVNLGSDTRMELGLVTKKEDNVYGWRPTITHTMGALTLRAGIEHIQQRDAKTQSGYGLSVGYSADPLTANFNLAKSSDRDASSMGVNVIYGNLGVGFIQDKDTAADKTANTVYAAYSFPLLGIKNATITPAISHGTVTGGKSVNGLRVRINYAF